MAVSNGAAPAMAGSADELLRPHCLVREACQAKGDGHCRRCSATFMNQDPARRAQVAAAVSERWRTDPAARAAHIRATRAGIARSLNDPAQRERRSRSGREHGQFNIGATRSPEVRARAGAAIRARRLAWCPPEFWPRNADLKRQGVRLAERQDIIAREAEEARVAHLDHEAAAAFARRFAPTIRCDAAGTPDQVGTHYRYGRAVKTRAELIRLALAKGWNPDPYGAGKAPASTGDHHAD